MNTDAELIGSTLKNGVLPLSQDLLQQKIDTLVEKFQYKLEHTAKVRGNVGRYLQALYELGRPVTTSDVHAHLKLNKKSLGLFHTFSRIDYLVKLGCVRVIGKTRTSYHEANVYQFLSWFKPRSLLRVQQWLDKELDKLHFEDSLTLSKLVSDAAERISSARKKEMVNLYASGCSKAEVGRQFGVSRERVRQIVAEALKA